MSEADAYALDRAKQWATIERKHFGMCIWQQRHPSGKAMLEGRIHKATGQIMVVETGYESRLPSEGVSKPWPLVAWVNIYAPLDTKTNSWEGLDQALADWK